MEIAACRYLVYLHNVAFQYAKCFAVPCASHTWHNILCIHFTLGVSDTMVIWRCQEIVEVLGNRHLRENSSASYIPRCLRRTPAITRVWFAFQGIRRRRLLALDDSIKWVLVCRIFRTRKCVLTFNDPFVIVWIKRCRRNWNIRGRVS